MKLHVLGVVAICSFTLLVPPARADTVTITGGTLTSSPYTASLSLTGDGVALSGGLMDGISDGGFACEPCSSMPPVPLSLSALANSNEGGISLVYKGVEYSGASNNTVVPTLNFSSPTFSTAVLSSSHLTVTEPFTMTGSVDVLQGLPFGSGGSGAAFTLDVLGSGIATAQFSQNPSTPGQRPLFQLASVDYAFEPNGSPSPTPEPASIMLLATGLLGAVLVHRRLAF